jgi:pimeloyl-ACP methyl ester carboxylesterase
MGTAPYASEVTPSERPAGPSDTRPGRPDPREAGEPDAMVVSMDTGERIAYLDWGGPEATPCILVHGLGRTAWSWAPVARRLRLATRAAAVDLRGHGASDAPREGYGLESLATDVLTVASANGWGADVAGPRVVLAGHGLGAMVAAVAAAMRPESAAAVALLDAGWESAADATRLSPDELLAVIADPPEVLASMETYLADRRDFDPHTWDDDQERAARSQVEQKHAGHVSPVTRPSVVRRLVAAMYEYQPVETLLGVRCPLLAVVAGPGGADDEERRERLLALEDVLRARTLAGLPPADVLRLDGAGHDVMRHRPGPVADAILRLSTTAVTTSPD